MNGEQDQDGPSPQVQKRDPEQDLENELRDHPDDLDKKADVGSDESMDASDPPAAAQPGQNDDPVPSSGFPEYVALTKQKTTALQIINSDGLKRHEVKFSCCRKDSALIQSGSGWDLG